MIFQDISVPTLLRHHVTCQELAKCCTVLVFSAQIREALAFDAQTLWNELPDDIRTVVSLKFSSFS